MVHVYRMLLASDHGPKANHDRRLENALSRIRSSGIKLNRSKCILGSNQINYLGQLLTLEGVKADPRKVSTTLDRPCSGK